MPRQRPQQAAQEGTAREGVTMPLRIVLLLTLVPSSLAWHDLTNEDYHCWPAAASGPIPSYQSCPGVSLKWIQPPPSPVKAGEPFNTTYELIVDASFYRWAVGNNIKGFMKRDGSVRTSNATEAQDWCENIVCPTSLTSINLDSCCIWHVNVHACPLSNNVSFCGPWISPVANIYTHSAVLWGAARRGNWTSHIEGMIVPGTTQLIAHFKYANLQFTLFKNVKVLPRAVCGNDICEKDDGERCSTCSADCGTCPLEGWQIGIIAVVAALVLAAMLGVVGYFQYQKRKLFWDESWIIPYEEIRADNAVRGFMGSAVSIKASQTSKDMFGGNALAQQAANKQVFCTTGIYHGKTIAIRDIKRLSFTLTKTMRREVKAVRELDHSNVAKFVGGVTEVPNVSIAMEYCPKGSLSDILLNDDIPLNWGFRFSFAGDIAKGMTYLHSANVLHGHLKTNNCIVDDRWTVKITDYGLPTYREEERNEDDEDYFDVIIKDKRARVYRAPETFSAAYTAATPEADVYAFGIILCEIATRNDPYGDEDPDEVDDYWKPEVPNFEDDEDEKEENRCPCPKDYQKLVDQCWQESPNHRLTFLNVKRTLAKINPSQQSPVDMMMQLMEKYSKHLETLVGERTQDLIIEQQKTDRLLYSMMPKKIADDLRMGKQIDAEWFDTCTIYFSDIVGFTSLSGKSTPYQVVGLLNKLYTTFDSIIDIYDVYKVETIGDAYMVVSGVPNVNGIRHAHQVACMSIDLVSASESFVIPHLPEEPLKVRVGMHTGPVCAGVVGLKMPRYCLFGDTVNTASRMESNGEAYRIHLSHPTHELLQQAGGFNTEYRGVIPVKGKGEMRTYWLLGYDETTASPRELVKEVNQEIDDIVLDNGNFSPHELNTDAVDQSKTDDQRKISTLTADSGYNENGTASPVRHNHDAPQGPVGATDPPPVDV